MTTRHYRIAGLLALLAVVPQVVPEFHVTLLNYIGLAAIVALGLVLLTGVGGLTSFGQAAFVGLGAYTTAYLTSAQALSPWVALAVGMGLTSAVALLLGLLTLRLSGHYLPLGTIAWGISLYFLFGNLELLGKHTGISGIPALNFFGWELKDGRRMAYLIWVMVLGTAWLTQNLLHSREGRAIRALKGGTIMAEAMGVNTARSKVVIFVLAALWACLSGWLYAHLQRFVNPTPFGLHVGIEYLFMAVIGGAVQVWGALVGASLIVVLKEILQGLLPGVLGSAGNFEGILFGMLMVLVLHRAREGLTPMIGRWCPSRKPPTPVLPAEPVARRATPARGQVLLEAREVVKRFGGLVANNRVSLTVRAGETLALIGPNGAGKSTLFNCLSGVSGPTSGQVLFCGENVSGWPARRIAQRGLSRTFQHVRLLPAMSVLENVAIGAHRRGHKGVLSAMCHLDRKEEQRLLAEAARQLQRVGLQDLMFEPAGNLALGQQRILEIARALCADPCVLLLDEPAAGLRLLEKQALAGLLRRLQQEGMGILLVEHDMEFVMGLADRVVVMEFGEKIAEGEPDAIQRDPRVLEAYLGGAIP